MKEDNQNNFLLNDNLISVNPHFTGNYYNSGVFIDKFNRKHPSRLEFIKHGLTRNPQKQEKKLDQFRPELILSNDFFDRNTNQLIWLGHASFFLCMEGINILIDPVFFDLPFYKRKVGIPCLPEKFSSIDYILISHDHRDHCDLKTLNILLKNNPDAVILTGLKMSRSLKVLKTAKIQEAGWYQQFITDPKIKIIFTPAKHWSRRFLHDMNRSLWGSFFIQTESTPIFYAGDTAYSDHFSEITNILGAPDISIFPIGTYKPDYIMKKSHLDPDEAYAAFLEMRSKVFISMHYGTYDLSNEPLGEPIRKTEFKFNESDEFKKLKVLKVGEKFYLDKV